MQTARLSSLLQVKSWRRSLVRVMRVMLLLLMLLMLRRSRPSANGALKQQQKLCRRRREDCERAKQDSSLPAISSKWSEKKGRKMK